MIEPLKPITDFVTEFTDFEFKNIVKLENNFYLASDELLELKQKIPIQAFSAGTFIGTMRGKHFIPSPSLLDLLSKHSNKKVLINDKAEWLFICGKDVFGKSIIDAKIRSGLVLIQNRIDENLGYGKIVAPLDQKERVVIKNFLDKGDYLRKLISARED